MPTKALAIVLTLLLASAAAYALETAEEIQECSRKNEPKRSAVQSVDLIAKDRIGAQTRLHAKIYWRRDDKGLSKVMVRILHPPDLRQAGLLVLENKKRSDMFLFMPEIGHTRRITKHMGAGSLFGTDFTYEDFERLQGFVRDETVERVEDQEVDGRACYVLTSHPGIEDESVYEKVVTYVDRETCVPLRLEMYEVGDELRKRIEVDFASVKEVGGALIPHSIKAVDIRDQTESTLVVLDVKIDQDLPRKYFTARWLETGRE